MEKKVECELLYEQILKLAENNVVSIHPNLKPQLQSEATKWRDKNISKIITPELKEAGKQLKNHPDILVRKADKANIFVVMDKAEYNRKLESIINDKSKFELLNRNPVSDLKVKVNKLIADANK